MNKRINKKLKSFLILLVNIKQTPICKLVQTVIATAIKVRILILKNPSRVYRLIKRNYKNNFCVLTSSQIVR